MGTDASPVLAEALRWMKRGASPIPVQYRSKVPVGSAWQDQRLGSNELPAVFNGTPINLGILWGTASGHLVDVDLDWAEAAAIADLLLPRTATYGRPGARASHRLFFAEGARTLKWKVPATVAAEGMVLELRADGTQSVVPPSTHPSGELYEWERDERPRRVPAPDLVAQLDLVAAGALLVRCWHDGIRHELALALAGAMLGAAHAAEGVEKLVGAVAQAAGDPEVLDRVKAAQSTLEAIRAGRPAVGLPKLAELVGEPVVGVLKRWLRLGDSLHGLTVGGSQGSALPFPQEEDGELTVRQVSQFAEEPVRWLWPNRFARGKLSMIAGKQGLSKSTLTVEIGAIVSRADAWPIDGTRAEGGEVLFLNAEDDPSDTIRPRLRAAGAVLERVHIIEGVRLSSGKRRLVTLADVALLDTYLAKHPGRFALLIVDPVGAFLAGKDSHKDSEVRELLAPLKDVAERHGLAVVLVAHLNKAAGFDAIYRVVGSVAFTAVVRALYILAPDPEDEQRLLLLPEKASNAPANMAGLSYRLQSADLGNGIVAPRIVWETIEMRSADQVLNPPRPDREAPDRDQAEVWLREQLADGPVPVKELRQAAGDELACSWDTVKRAADVLGLVGRGEKKARTWELSSKGAREQKGEVHESKGCTQAPADGKGAASPSRAPSTLAPLHLSELPTGSPDEPDGDVL